MVTSNKDAARIWAEIEKARAVGTEVTVEDAKNLNNAPGRGPNDLEERIEELMKIELSHRNLNAELRKELKYQTDQAKFYKHYISPLFLCSSIKLAPILLSSLFSFSNCSAFIL